MLVLAAGCASAQTSATEVVGSQEAACNRPGMYHTRMGILRFLRAPKVVQINVTDFAAAHRAGCVVVDVRESHEYVRGHVPGAKSMPLRHVSQRASELPQDRVIHVICASGHRSRVAARILEASGLEVRSVAGGTSAWVRQKLPLVGGAKPGKR